MGREDMGKNKDIKKLLKYIWIVYAVFSVFFVIYLADQLVCKEIMEVSKQITLDKQWMVIINDMPYENVDLNNFKFDTVKKGDKIVMERMLPKEWEYGEAAMCVNNCHTTLEMYVDDVLRYQYGQERVEKNKATGSGYLLINFYDEYKGKTLRLEYVVTENNAFSKLSEVWISEWGNAYRYIITQNRLPMLAGCFLIVFGVMMTLVLTFAVTVSTKYVNVLCLAIFSICIGIWTLCYYNIMIVFSIPLYSISLMEYMSLFLSPLPIMAYVYTFVKELNRKILLWIYYVLFCVQLVLSIVTIALHTTDTVHGAQMLPVFQMMFVFHMLLVFYSLIKRRQKSKKGKKIIVIGLMMVSVCVLYELVGYSIMRYVGFHMLEFKGAASVGFIVFLGVLILELYQRVTKSMMEEQEKLILIKRAYTDELTQLYNRAYCSDFMQKIDEVKSQTYTVMSFDLNGLKQTNDTYGHSKGDELICHAANVLNASFSSQGIVGRMGGDEFIAIIEKNDQEEIERLIEEFQTCINTVNEQNPGLDLSISYGYATNEELKNEGIEKVYQLADKRMYEYKRKIKSVV